LHHPTLDLTDETPCANGIKLLFGTDVNYMYNMGLKYGGKSFVYRKGPNFTMIEIMNKAQLRIEMKTSISVPLLELENFLDIDYVYKVTNSEA
jgi:hypothetical protein